MNLGDSVILRSRGADHEAVVNALTRSRVTVDYTDSMGDARSVTVAVERVRATDHPAISVEDLAAISRVHPSTVRRQIAGDTLPVPFVRIGQRIVIPSVPVREMFHLG